MVRDQHDDYVLLILYFIYDSCFYRISFSNTLEQTNNLPLKGECLHTICFNLDTSIIEAYTITYILIVKR